MTYPATVPVILKLYRDLRGKIPLQLTPWEHRSMIKSVIINNIKSDEVENALLYYLYFTTNVNKEIIMRLVTLLNRCCRFKSFVFQRVKISNNGKSIIITIKPRKNSHPICSICKTESPGYDKTGNR